MAAVSLMFHVFSFGLWAFAALVNAPSLYALLRGRAKHNDVAWAKDFFVCTMIMGFSIRWLVFPDAIGVMRPDEMMLWIGLQTLSCMCAVAAIGTRLSYGR